MEIFIGRPSDLSGRDEAEVRSYDLLDSLGIEYTRADHECAMTMEICAGIDDALGVRICKNLFLCNRQQTDFYLLLMPDDKPFKTKDLSAQLGVSRLSFAGSDHMERLLGLAPGSVSVLGLMFDTEKCVRLLIDRDLLPAEFFGCHPCRNTSSLRFKTSDLTEKLLPALGYSPTVIDLPRYEVTE